MVTDPDIKRVEGTETDLTQVSSSISIVASNGPQAVGGLATVVRNVAGELAKAHPVRIVSRFEGENPNGLSYIDRETPRRVHADNLSVEIIGPAKVAVPGLPLVQPLLYRPLTQSVAKRIFSLAFERSVARAVPRETQVIHFVGAGWELFGFPARAVARRRDAIFSVWPAIHPGVWGDSPVDASLYRDADIVFAQSRFERRRLVEMGVKEDRVVLTGCAPATDHKGDGNAFRARYRLGAAPLVLFIGRKTRAKGYHALCEAFHKLRETVPPARLVVVGTSCERPYPHVDGRIDLGCCGDREKADALAACDVLCVPSQEESFGIVYVEGWAAGKPVLAGMAPAVQELVREGVDGFCVDQNPDAIAVRLAEMLTQRELRARLGKAGMQRQQAHFTWPAVAALHVAAFAAAQERRGIVRT